MHKHPTNLLLTWSFLLALEFACLLACLLLHMTCEHGNAIHMLSKHEPKYADRWHNEQKACHPLVVVMCVHVSITALLVLAFNSYVHVTVVQVPKACTVLLRCHMHTSVLYYSLLVHSFGQQPWVKVATDVVVVVVVVVVM